MRAGRATLLATCVALGLRTQASATDITVTRFDDPEPTGCSTDDCSLREAVIQANAFVGPDRIFLDAGTYLLSIIDSDEDESQGGDLDINDDVTITGAGADQTKIRWALPVDRIFDVHPGAPDPYREVALRGMTLEGGGAPSGVGTHYGGGIQAINVAIELSDITLNANSADGGVGGGAYIYVFSLRLGDVRATGNRALIGGGLYAEQIFSGTMSVTGLTATGNTADRCAGASLGTTFGGTDAPLRFLDIEGNSADHDGGGLCLGALQAGLVLSDSVVDGNIAGNSGSGNGGGILLDARTYDADSWGTAVEIRTTRISNNTAKGNGGGISFGPDALATWEGECDLRLVSSSVESNHAIDGIGGGIYMAPTFGAIGGNQCTAHLVDASVSGNEATAGGGGGGASTHGLPLAVIDSTFENNTAGYLGGGLLAGTDSSVVIQGSTFTANEGAQYGGAIETFADALLIDNSTFYANTSNFGATIDNNQMPVSISESTLVAAPGDNSAGSVYANFMPGNPAHPVFSRTILAGRCMNDAPVANDWDIGSPGTGCSLASPSVENVSAASLALGPLADNGGPTSTMLPQPGSFAIGFLGDQCAPYDQRGFLRTAPCDVGAAESDGIDDLIFASGFDS